MQRNKKEYIKRRVEIYMISVCMATYNGEKFIKEQIESILQQLNQDDELIISDDGSTDDTIGIINSFHDKRIKLLRFNKKCYTQNFENALKHAKGNYIFLSDQDDIWLPGKVDKCLEVLQNSDFTVTDAKVVDENKNVLLDSYFKYCKIKKGFFYNVMFTRYIGACMAFRKEVLESILPIPKNEKYIAHDYWIACVCEKKYKVSLIDTPLLFYRRHSNNTSSGIFGQSKLKLYQKIYKRIYILYLLRFK